MAFIDVNWDKVWDFIYVHKNSFLNWFFVFVWKDLTHTQDNIIISRINSLYWGRRR